MALFNTRCLQLYLQSTPLPLKSAQISSVLSLRNTGKESLRCNDTNDWCFYSIEVFSISTYLSQHQPHCSTFSQCCCWSHSDTCHGDPASHEESKRHRHPLKCLETIPKQKSKNSAGPHCEFSFYGVGNRDSISVPLISGDWPSHSSTLQLQGFTDLQVLAMRLDHQLQPTI